jgi:hypothetical protein
MAMGTRIGRRTGFEGVFFAMAVVESWLSSGAVSTGGTPPAEMAPGRDRRSSVSMRVCGGDSLATMP